MSTVPEAPVRVRAARPGLIDAKVLLVAAALTSPVAVRVSQGMLSLTDALIRYLLVVVACAAAGALVRTLMPEPARPVPPEPAPQAQESAGQDTSPAGGEQHPAER